MGSEEKPTKKSSRLQDAAAGGYVPPPLQSAGKQHLPTAYVPPSVSQASQYLPPQYIPPAITPMQAPYVDPMAPVGSAMPPLVIPPIANSNPTQNHSNDYLAAERTITPFADIPTRTIFLPRKSNPILGFIIVGVIGMMGIVIVGLIVALSKKEDGREASLALNAPIKQSTAPKSSNPASSPTNTDAKNTTQPNSTIKTEAQSASKQIAPPMTRQNAEPPRMARDKFRNDRPNRPNGMGNKNRPRPQMDDLPKNEPHKAMEKMPAQVPENSPPPPNDSIANNGPKEPENNPATSSAPATAEPSNRAVVANHESRAATPEQEKEFLNSLKKIRVSLEARDFDNAKKEQEKADKLAISDDMKTMAEGMDMISQYNVIFWKFVQDAMRNLNGEIEIGSQAAFVVTSNSESMTVRIQGKNRDFSFNTLPAGLAVAIAKKAMNDDPANQATLAAFYFTHPKMDKLKDTKELFATAKKRGVKTDSAMFLLEKEHLISAK